MSEAVAHSCKVLPFRPCTFTTAFTPSVFKHQSPRPQILPQQQPKPEEYLSLSSQSNVNVRRGRLRLHHYHYHQNNARIIVPSSSNPHFQLPMAITAISRHRIITAQQTPLSPHHHHQPPPPPATPRLPLEDIDRESRPCHSLMCPRRIRRMNCLIQMTRNQQLTRYHHHHYHHQHRSLQHPHHPRLHQLHFLLLLLKMSRCSYHR